jgi:hypothetical protein
MMENTHRKVGDEAKKKYVNINLHTPLTKYLQATCWETLLWNKLALTAHYIRSYVLILYSSVHNSINY